MNTCTPPNGAKWIRVLIPNHTKRRSGKFIPNVEFIVAHDTGNPSATALNNAHFYTTTSGSASQSAHLFVDDKYIIECVPVYASRPEKAWHVLYNVPEDNRMFGANANDVAIGLELCFGGKIDNVKAYQNYVWAMARISNDFKLNPLTDIVGHMILDPSRRTDPQNAMTHIGKKYSELKYDVNRVFREEFKGKVLEGAPVDTVKVNILGKDASGITMSGNTYIKIRELENLGFAVTWDETNKEAIVTKK